LASLLCFPMEWIETTRMEDLDIVDFVGFSQQVRVGCYHSSKEWSHFSCSLLFSSLFQMGGAERDDETAVELLVTMYAEGHVQVQTMFGAAQAFADTGALSYDVGVRSTSGDSAPRSMPLEQVRAGE
jgi:hypothetical protein